MIELLEAKGKLKPIHEVALAFSRSNPQVVAMQDIIHYLQLSVYWLEFGAAELYQTQISEDLEHGETKGVPWPATPQEIDASGREQLDFLFNKLLELEDHVWDFVQKTFMDPKPKFYLNNAITKIAEAKMLTILAGIQHEKLPIIGRLN